MTAGIWAKTAVAIVVCLVWAAAGTSAFGQAKASRGEVKEKKEELPKSGVLSRSLGTGYQSTNVDMPWGSDGKDSAGGAASGRPPISGSVSKVSPAQWLMRVFNNSEDSYSVNLRVIQRDMRGTVLKSDSFSYNLRPGQKAERSISSYRNTADAELNLVSWKKLSPPKKAEDGEAVRKKAGGAEAAAQTRKPLAGRR